MAKEHKLMDKDELSCFVAKEIATALPMEFITEAIKLSIEGYIKNFRIDDYLISKLLQEVVLEKTKELVRTTYSKIIEDRAAELAAQAIANMRR